MPAVNILMQNKIEELDSAVPMKLSEIILDSCPKIAISDFQSHLEILSINYPRKYILMDAGSILPRQFGKEHKYSKFEVYINKNKILPVGSKN